jgi:hypothetical protein
MVVLVATVGGQLDRFSLSESMELANEGLFLCCHNRMGHIPRRFHASATLYLIHLLCCPAGFAADKRATAASCGDAVNLFVHCRAAG